jgi:acyl carrier protein
VRDAVTFGVPHRTLGEDVAAAVVLAEGATLAPAALRQFAAERVATFKVPRRITFLDAIPRGLTGKPDRAALVRVDAIGAPAHVAPRTPLEAALAEIWAEMLGLPRVGVLDDFFDHGGDSLLAARLVARLRDRLGLDVPLRQIFETSTIADLTLALLDAHAETGLFDPTAAAKGGSVDAEIGG